MVAEVVAANVTWRSAVPASPAEPASIERAVARRSAAAASASLTTCWRLPMKPLKLVDMSAIGPTPAPSNRMARSPPSAARRRSSAWRSSRRIRSEK
ncbi:hypothetical protein D3C72_681200 [compost metagenome]